jgi:NADPH:quinone reductase-like Zn-dependent oxidoreductase
MKLRYKVLIAVIGVIAASGLALALVLSHATPCGTVPAATPTATSMKALVRRCYGPPEVVQLDQIARPAVADDAVLVRVHAVSLNPLDWHVLRGDPYIMRAGMGIGAPKDVRFGVDFAGTVEAVGRNVTRFKPGDAVFGGTQGAFAEYVTVGGSGPVALKPDALTFEQAAAVPVAGITALQALRDYGKVQPGQKVLINGASGGVGLFAVQIAKALGASVTGVSSSKSIGLVASLGADQLIDYTRQDYADGSQLYDVILDLVSNRSLAENRRALKPNGIYIGLGGGSPRDGGLLGPLIGAMKLATAAHFVSQRLLFFEADLNQKDMDVLRDLIQSGKLSPVVDRQFALDQAARALDYLEDGHAHGKIVLTLD